MAQVTASDLYPLVVDFLTQTGLTKTLKRFKKESQTVRSIYII